MHEHDPGFQIWINDMLRGGPLLDEKARATLPPLYSGEKLGADAKAKVKFILPGSDGIWYASEFDGQDTFFGLVSGFEVELGYFSYSELAELRTREAMVVVRDEMFKETPLDELMDQHKANRNHV